MLRSLVRTLLTLAALAPLPLTPSSAQLIPIRTVPVASGDQFWTLPSTTVGMGGVRVAVDDSLSDPWTNPAKGVFISESAFLGSPTYYSISGRGGAGRSFPVSGLFAEGRWFGGAALALQQIENDRGRGDFILLEPGPWRGGRASRLSDASARNLYASGFFGRRVGAGVWSVGLGFSAAHLNALDGVDLLYAGAENIDQSGSTADVRLGLYRAGERSRLAIIVLHNRISMTHDVTYLDWSWDPQGMIQVVEPRLEQNEDKTRSWGTRVSWDRKLDAPGWRFGASVTANRKSHPKIPNYEIQNIPRDPGTTWAYEGAIGFSRTKGATIFGMDLAFQPIWSNTWQNADIEVVTDTGRRIPAGGRTIENDFFFTNVMIRAGLSHEIGRTGVQAGLEVRSYDYELEQVSYLEGTFRKQRESWMEWTPTLGAVFRFSDLELRYTGRLTTGTGRPGVDGRPRTLEALSAGADFITAPEGPLTLQDATVITHQLSVRIPVR
jgi:hypothetical protein